MAGCRSSGYRDTQRTDWLVGRRSNGVCRRSSMNWRSKVGSNSSRRNCPGRPELQLLIRHVARLEVFVLPGWRGLQTRPGVLLLLLDHESPAIVVIDVHYMGRVSKSQGLIASKDE